MEDLDRLMRVASQSNWIRGFPLKKRVNDTIELTHILYAEDTLFFCEAEQEQICYLRVILVVFGMLRTKSKLEKE